MNLVCGRACLDFFFFFFFSFLFKLPRRSRHLLSPLVKQTGHLRALWILQWQQAGLPQAPLWLKRVLSGLWGRFAKHCDVWTRPAGPGNHEAA